MIEFAPLELCKKLQAMGCKSESGFYWYCFDDEKLLPHEDYLRKNYIPQVSYGKESECFGFSYIEAYIQNDFTGSTDQADKNCFIVWPNESIRFCESGYYPMGLFMAHRHTIIAAHKNGETWHQYLERTIRR